MSVEGLWEDGDGPTKSKKQLHRLECPWNDHVYRREQYWSDERGAAMLTQAAFEKSARKCGLYPIQKGNH